MSLSDIISTILLLVLTVAMITFLLGLIMHSFDIMALSGALFIVFILSLLGLHGRIKE